MAGSPCRSQSRLPDTGSSNAADRPAVRSTPAARAGGASTLRASAWSSGSVILPPSGRSPLRAMRPPAAETARIKTMSRPAVGLPPDFQSSRLSPGESPMSKAATAAPARATSTRPTTEDSIGDC